MSNERTPYLIIWDGKKQEPVTDEEVTVTFRKVSGDAEESKYAPTGDFVVGTHNPQLVDVLKQIAMMYSTIPISSYEGESA
jgi:hypothetical protein